MTGKSKDAWALADKLVALIGLSAIGSLAYFSSSSGDSRIAGGWIVAAVVSGSCVVLSCVMLYSYVRVGRLAPALFILTLFFADREGSSVLAGLFAGSIEPKGGVGDLFMHHSFLTSGVLGAIAILFYEAGRLAARVIERRES